jgi:hypothetical protein
MVLVLYGLADEHVADDLVDRFAAVFLDERPMLVSRERLPLFPLLPLPSGDS